MINTSLLRSTMDHIAERPELHHQTGFYEVNEFGVAACFAGRALLLAGYEPAIPEMAFSEGIGARTSLAYRPFTYEPVPVWNEARDLLGLTREQAKNLFGPSLTRSMLESQVAYLLNQPVLEEKRYYDILFSR